MPEEIFDIVDENDRTIGQKPRSVVHQNGYLHRGVHVWLFTEAGKLLVQQRSADREHAPSALDCSVSEHVKAGESFDVAAVRGLQEELGLDGIGLQPLVKFQLDYGPNDNEISQLYQGKVDPSHVHFDPVEVAGIAYHDLAELSDMIKKGDPPGSRWLAQIFNWYLGRPSELKVLKLYETPRLFLL